MVVIKTNGEISKLNGKVSLEEMQKIVGGYIQIVPLILNTSLICNDEGKLMCLPINEKATILWEMCYGKTDIIVGDVIIANDKEIE